MLPPARVLWDLSTSSCIILCYFARPLASQAHSFDKQAKTFRIVFVLFSLLRLKNETSCIVHAALRALVSFVWISFKVVQSFRFLSRRRLGCRSTLCSVSRRSVESFLSVRRISCLSVDNSDAMVYPSSDSTSSFLACACEAVMSILSHRCRRLWVDIF
ncbi:hypothetical protein SISSUDRAFT_440549 [Sistotremastrum suecicum HHB10207 ss-3]|uniref:Uncharacterized protein n=1 Tax=Sistotremastrum suecicum HHB10207 ss-3 TaxID=1314776 RepID=A0A166FK17_9AGAM|nr:hypothetical protein SISSUDRAFT_440549 [Sistotremastrum suecicum HHB10207 ss-3]